MASEKHDMSNPMIATPVAMIAGQIAAGLAAQLMRDQAEFSISVGQQMVARAEISVTLAELIVTDLQNRGHLPRTTETEEPAADDMALIGQGYMLGCVMWEAYGLGDPRGVLRFFEARSLGSPLNYQFPAKLDRGQVKLDDPARNALKSVIASALRRL